MDSGIRKPCTTIIISGGKGFLSAFYLKFKTRNALFPVFFFVRYAQNEHLYNQLRTKRSLKLRRRLRRFASDFASPNSTIQNSRTKRQSTSGQTLCETRSRYVMPRAAANKEGQWFYVVNVPGYTQQVNTEVCV